MPNGTVRDDGDPGGMKGQKIGLIKPDDQEDKDLLPFNNDQKLKKKDPVSYDIGSCNGWEIAINVEKIE